MTDEGVCMQTLSDGCYLETLEFAQSHQAGNLSGHASSEIGRSPAKNTESIGNVPTEKLTINAPASSPTVSPLTNKNRLQQPTKQASEKGV